MHEIWLPTTDETLTFTEYIDELTNEQYLFYCEMICAFQKGDYSFFEIKVLLVYKLLNMEVTTLKNEVEIATKNENIHKLTEAVESLFLIEKKKGKIIVQPSIDFVDNKLPTLTINDLVFHGPEDMFGNLTFLEHMHAMHQYASYVKTKEETHLDQLLAILYRPAKPSTPENIESAYNGDKRKPYYPAKSMEIVPVFKQLDFHYKFAVYLWFQAVQEYLCTATEIDVLGVPCDFSVLFQEQKTKLKGIGMPGVLFSLTETRVIGTKKETENELYLNILLVLYKQHLDAENLKTQTKNGTNN